ncbi:MAG: penicillin-insensitive murein endopeptidase, partial [Gammaproteobacteria bacterium]
MSQRSTGLTKILLCLVALLIPAVKSAAADFRGRGAANPSGIEASLVFGNQKTAANLASAAVGSYSKGCLAGAEPLPIDGPHWQAMRLSRNRNWGHPELLNYIRRFSTDAAVLEEWPGLLVGDLSQPRGGPMLSGHKSHQIGLDVDIWFRPSPQ